jgi:DNA-binding MarR family transcriptional regulator
VELNQLTLRIAAAWRDLRRIKQRDLSIPLPIGQIDTLDVIARIGPCSMLALSEALRIDASTATRAVEPLVNSELVQRRRSDRDARTVLVELTRAGRRVERQLTIERLANVENALVGFTDDERVLLADLLERLVAGSTQRTAGVEAGDGDA